MHTHWGEEVIVESFFTDQDIYLNGPKRNATEEALRPYSFVFSHRGPLPVEFMDDTVSVRRSELEEMYQFIRELNEAVVSQLDDHIPIPIGVMIDHRFKESLWDHRMYSFAEGDSDEYEGRAIVQPVFESVVNPTPPIPGTVTVAWSSYPHEEFPKYPLAETQKRLFLALESRIKRQPPHKAKVFVDTLEWYLSN